MMGAFVAGLFYFLGAYFMWIVGDDKEPSDIKLRPWYAAFWPFVIVFHMLKTALNLDDEGGL